MVAKVYLRRMPGPGRQSNHESLKDDYSSSHWQDVPQRRPWTTKGTTLTKMFDGMLSAQINMNDCLQNSMPWVHPRANDNLCGRGGAHLQGHLGSVGMYG